MRLRFSIRALFIVFTIVSIAFYVTIVRPNVLAERFIAATERGDFETVHELLREDDWRIWSSAGVLSDKLGPIDRVYVEILPREWSDWWACHRRLIFRTARHTDDNGRHVEWTEDDEITAGISGLEITTQLGW
ncbi:MAG: hypothetical protein WD738_21395 [Pirellulales bacterium]